MTGRKEKSEIRRVAKQRRSQQAEIPATSDRIVEYLWHIDEFVKAQSVCCYVSFRDEVETHRLIRDLLGQAKRVSVPFCLTHELEIFQIESFDELSPGTMQILEPERQVRVQAGRKVRASELDAIVVPGLGFTKRGGRIGYGRGYYDRLLATATSACKIGICFECQLFESLPQDQNDARMDFVVTETGTCGS